MKIYDLWMFLKIHFTLFDKFLYFCVIEHANKESGYFLAAKGACCIGSNTVVELQAGGYEVVVIDSLSSIKN